MPVIFGLGLIVLLVLLADGLGRPAVVMAALLAAISPAMVFYSRYYIQETLLVFFMLAALGCGWRYLRTRRLAWILAAGAAVGMMHATKETWILSAAAAVAAAGLTWGWSRLRDAHVPLTPPGEGSRGEGSSCLCLRLLFHILAAVLTACLVAAAFFSMFGKNWQGPGNSIWPMPTTFIAAASRASTRNRGTIICNSSSPIGLRNGSFGARVLLPCWR